MSIKTLIQRQQVNYIVRSFSAQERAFMGLSKNYIGINPGYWAKGEKVKNIFIEYDHFKPIAFFHITNFGDYLNASVGVYNSEQYRNKGYAQKVVQRGLNWYRANKNELGNKPIYWWAKTDNPASCKLAEKCGFKQETCIFDIWFGYIYFQCLDGARSVSGEIRPNRGLAPDFPFPARGIQWA